MMKNIQKLLIVSVLLTVTLSCHQDRKNEASSGSMKSIRTIHEIQLFKTLPTSSFESILDEIIELNNEGKLNLYSAASTDELISFDEIMRNYFELAMPDSLLSPEEQLSTTLANIRTFNLAEKITFDLSKNKIDHKIVAISPVVYIEFAEGKYIRHPLFWIKIKEFSQAVSETTYESIINAIFVNLFNTEDLNTNPIDRSINERIVKLDDFMGKFTVKEFNEYIYQQALTGKLPSYPNDSLNQAFNTESFRQLGRSEEIIEIVPDMDNPEFTFDSVVVNEFRPEDILGNSISYKWGFNKSTYSYSLKIHALGITYNLHAADQDLGEQTLFWVKTDDLKRSLGKCRYQLLIKSIMREHAQLHQYEKFLN